MFLKISVLKNFENFYWKTPVLKSLFNKVTGFQICKMFKNIFFDRIPPVAAFLIGIWHFPINPFHVTGLFLYPLKTPENMWFSDVLKGAERDQLHEMA